MSSNFWEQSEQLTVPNGGSAIFTLKYNAPLERLTIWALSGARSLTNMTFQLQINGVNFGTSTNILGAVAAGTVWTSGGFTKENLIFPRPAAAGAADGRDPFVLTMLVSNAGGSPELVTLRAAATTHVGG